MSGAAVAEALDRAISKHGKPNTITVDHGTEFTSRALDEWAYRRGIALDFIRPGKPVENGHIESFNGKLRDECLNAHQFLSIDDARRKIEGVADGLQPASATQCAQATEPGGVPEEAKQRGRRSCSGRWDFTRSFVLWLQKVREQPLSSCCLHQRRVVARWTLRACAQQRHGLKQHATICPRRPSQHSLPAFAFVSAVAQANSRSEDEE
jgi:hypothetical protein